MLRERKSKIACQICCRVCRSAQVVAALVGCFRWHQLLALFSLSLLMEPRGAGVDYLSLTLLVFFFFFLPMVVVSSATSSLPFFFSSFILFFPFFPVVFGGQAVSIFVSLSSSLTHARRQHKLLRQLASQSIKAVSSPRCLLCPQETASILCSVRAST